MVNLRERDERYWGPMDVNKFRLENRVLFSELSTILYVEIIQNSEFDSYAAQIATNLVEFKPDASFILPTGITPEGMCAILRNAALYNRLDLSHIKSFNLDAYITDPGHPGSYKSVMKRNLFGSLPYEVDLSIPNGGAENPALEADRYERSVREYVSKYGKIDLAIVGGGPSGVDFLHVAFNIPGSESTVDSKTHVVTLDFETIMVNKKAFAEAEEQYGWNGAKGIFPTQAITMGVGTILGNSEKVLVLLKGKSKARGAYNALFGLLSPDNPLGWIRTHPNVTVLLDEEAARYIKTG